jgi:hypothetical protein
MPRFYFDHRDGDEFALDEDGLDFATVEQARDEATAALAEMAKDALPGVLRRELAIEVSDHQRRPILRAALWFEVQILAGA